ncbi:MAG: acyl carrier protein [Clostridia bacterium]
MNNTIFEKVKDVIISKTDDKDVHLFLQTTISDICDSVQFVEVILALELEYNLQILLSDVNTVKTISDLVDVIKKQKRNKVKLKIFGKK